MLASAAFTLTILSLSLLETIQDKYTARKRIFGICFASSSAVPSPGLIEPGGGVSQAGGEGCAFFHCTISVHFQSVYLFCSLRVVVWSSWPQTVMSLWAVTHKLLKTISEYRQNTETLSACRFVAWRSKLIWEPPCEAMSELSLIYFTENWQCTCISASSYTTSRIWARLFKASACSVDIPLIC